MPGLSATVGEQIEALRRVAGEPGRRLIRREPDELIRRMVELGAGPGRDAGVRLGFAAESSFDEIIRVHIEDELGGSVGCDGRRRRRRDRRLYAQVARAGAEVVLVTEGELTARRPDALCRG